MIDIPHKRDEGSMILMLLKKEGPLSAGELKEDFYKFASQFGYGLGDHTERGHRKERKGNYFTYLDGQIEKLKNDDLIRESDGKFLLTEKGAEEAGKSIEKFKNASSFVNKNVFSAEAASRNTVIIDAILAVLKLFAGIVSGSVGLIADGTDAALDTVSAGVVFWSVKKKKEIIGTIVIIIMMFVTAIGLGIDSISSVITGFTGEPEAISNPVLVIVIETIALLFAILLMLYQRFIGKREKSFALITQSVDSKNHIYVALAVIAGAFLSMAGIIIVDSLIGVYIAVKIFIDAVALLKETLSAMKGEDIDFDKYDGILDKKWKENKMNSFRAVVIYHLLQKRVCTETELTDILYKNFQPSYLPVLSEFKLGFHAGLKFEEEFDRIVEPLTEKGIIRKSTDQYSMANNFDVKIEEYVSNTLVEAFDSEDFEEQVKRLSHHDFDSVDGIENMKEHFEKGEKIRTIIRGQYKKGIHPLVLSNRRIMIFSKKAKECESIHIFTIRDIVEESGKFGCMRLIIRTEDNVYQFDYLSPRKAFGFVSELHKYVNECKESNKENSEEDFYLKINTLSKIQKFISKAGIN